MSNIINSESDIDREFVAWSSERYTADKQVNAKIYSRVLQLLESGGYVSTSHFARAYLELVNEGIIKPFKGAVPVLPVAKPRQRLTAEDYNALSAQEVTRRYMRDPVFKADVESLVSAGKI